MEQWQFDFMEDEFLVRDYMYVGDELKGFPKFLLERGCINCFASKEHKRRTGNDYGFDHELMSACLLSGCRDKGYSLVHPFVDPEGLVRWVNEQDLGIDERENARDHLLNIRKRFGTFYERVGVSIEDLITQLHANRTRDFPDLLG